MIKISLFCCGGMSTSILASRMKKAASEKGIQAEIAAFSEAQLSNQLENLDAALIGPQISFMLPRLKKLCDEKNVPIAVIPSLDYGMMDGKKVLALALKLVNNK